MDYKEYLDLISNEVVELSRRSDNLNFITKETQKNINIYKSNYLNSFVNRFKADFQKLFFYIEEDNFIYLVREFIKARKIDSSVYTEVSKKFVYFLLETQSIHEDQIIPYLASLDYAWATGDIHPQFKFIPQGLLNLWKDLIPREEVLIDVDFNKMQVLEVKEEKGERFLILVQSSLFND